jgi:hypothetical protein
MNRIEIYLPARYTAVPHYLLRPQLLTRIKPLPQGGTCRFVPAF